MNLCKVTFACIMAALSHFVSSSEAWMLPKNSLSQSEFQFLYSIEKRKQSLFPVSKSLLKPLHNSLDDDFMAHSLPVIVILGVSIGIAAQLWISKMTQGDRGLGAFLKDGNKFAGSNFSTMKSSNDSVSGNDPLPWLRLPNLDFVEVAGQSSVNSKVEDLMRRMEKASREGKEELALELKEEIEASLAANGLETIQEFSKNS
jgi:hypothetical protein